MACQGLVRQHCLGIEFIDDGFFVTVCRVGWDKQSHIADITNTHTHRTDTDNTHRTDTDNTQRELTQLI